MLFIHERRRLKGPFNKMLMIRWWYYYSLVFSHHSISTLFICSSICIRSKNSYGQSIVTALPQLKKSYESVGNCNTFCTVPDWVGYVHSLDVSLYI